MFKSSHVGLLSNVFLRQCLHFSSREHIKRMQVKQVTSTNKPDCPRTSYLQSSFIEASSKWRAPKIWFCFICSKGNFHIPFSDMQENCMSNFWLWKCLFQFLSLPCRFLDLHPHLVCADNCRNGMFTHRNSLCVLAFYLCNFWSSPPDLIVTFEVLYPHSFSCPELSSSPSSL